MAFPQEQVDELSRFSPGCKEWKEGDKIYFHLPNLQLPDGCEPSHVDALLCPTLRDGYNSRLFFAVQIKTAKTLNWNALGVRILEHNWSAFSWRTIEGLRLAQMVSTHLGAL